MMAWILKALKITLKFLLQSFAHELAKILARELIRAYASELIDFLIEWLKRLIEWLKSLFDDFS